MASTSSSSTKKAAKLAQKGQGQKIRFQGGTVFPLAIAATLILGLALIVYARQTLPAADSSEPTINQHWHAAYGFYLCDTWYQLEGNLEERDSQGQFTNVKFLQSGIHSHDDGIMHWHPYTSKAVGRNAVLGVFLDTYGVELTNDSIKFPANNVLGSTDEYIAGETQCNGEDAEVTVKVWQSFTDTDGGTRYIANMDKIHIDNDAMVFAIYFTPRDADQTMPPWAKDLPQLGAADTGQIRPEDLVQSDSTSVGSAVPGQDSPVSGSVPGGSVPATSVPTASTPAVTTPTSSGG